MSLRAAFTTSVVFPLLVSVVFVSAYVNAASSSSAYFLPSSRTDFCPLAAFLFSNRLISGIHGSCLCII